MAFTKGNKLSTGRPKGSKNKTSLALKNQIKGLLDDNLPRVQADLDILEPRERVRAIIDLMAYCVPKLKSIDATVTSVNEFSDEKIAQLERMQELIDDIELERGQPSADIFDND